jgi:hypothetical protein
MVLAGTPVVAQPARLPADLALNITRTGYPSPSASVNSIPDSLYQAIDGRIWYFPEITNRWTTRGSASKSDWYEIDFGQRREISTLKIYPVDDGVEFAAPDSISMQFYSGDQWLPVKTTVQKPSKLVGNTVNEINFEKFGAMRIRINFVHISKQVAVSEIECY